MYNFNIYKALLYIKRRDGKVDGFQGHLFLHFTFSIKIHRLSTLWIF